MCTVILLRRPGHPWPVLIAANRDERLDRAWDPPGPWWPDRPGGILGGRDRDAGGTWMAMNAAGTVAAVLNRPGSLGPAPGKRSRGELPLLALEHGTARAAAAAIAALPAADWRPFNLVLADRQDAIFLRGTGAGQPEAVPLAPGLSMVTAHDPNSLDSPRTARHLPRFRAAPPPRPEAGDWEGWEALLADSGHGAGGVAETLTVPPTGGFGTICASLLAIPVEAGRAPLWRFAAGPAGRVPFRVVETRALT